jgi:endonuclease/exonuclease/phosphatase family metal-dependent hydrolase
MFCIFCASFAHADESSLKVLTFNTWLMDIPVYPLGFRRDVSREMNSRIQKMPAALAETGADIVVLEEVWSQTSKDTLIRSMRALGYPYAAYTKASNWVFLFQAAMGDGLLVLSKYPISNHVLHHDFSRATQKIESFASKGVLKLQIKHPTEGWVDLYASHLGAVDFENGDYVAAEVKIHKQQLKELATFMRETRDHPMTILAADLNMHYQKWEKNKGKPHFVKEFSDDYLELKHSACGFGQNLNDTYLQAHHKTVKDVPDYTFDQKNPYVGGGYYEELPSEVEDYIFVCDNRSMKLHSSSLVFQKNKLSDHYGVISSFRSTTPTHFHLAGDFKRMDSKN